ncbi:hypothetical protein TPHA_0J03210 [Tetrapisispora phaffii CBS 4417]|uniref:choline-phosphate cytidylyltransferase n=1 Tax=Tetrapisispora phaffii (strain ATCC 24235 / CBS 4417 / NBRC 1672 / NRRL Y-8282 / UCD 70-5) TaxID=1071381 RepID=G8BY89_TETPH|nr:hypothetical protein TPHA_0J03210 [Tetrapisispora phaffii CBS 4417]CCE65140.1 hypothetical protein TPHA_0J03210 [Tetrapisispora phaffii CBS 4417]
MANGKRRSILKKKISNSSLSNIFSLGKKRKLNELEDPKSAHINNVAVSNFRDNNGNNDRAPSNCMSWDEDSDKTQKRQHFSEDKKVSKEEKDYIEREKELNAKLPEELRRFRPAGYPFNIPRKDRPIRIYADGVFDLFHLGHMKQLEQCKKSFLNVTLICGVPSDEVTHKLKGLTVLTDKQRCETLRHCKWVDEVIADAPWCVTLDFLDEYNIDYVAHDDIPYVGTDSDDIYKPVKEIGKFLVTQRTEDVSTSDIITNIIRDYDKYLMRNFTRGATREELNISWMKQNELEFKKHINDFRSYFKKNQLQLNNAPKDLYFEVREMLLKKALGKKLYEKLTDNDSDKENNDDPKKFLNKTLTERKRLIEEGETSPAIDFANQYTGRKQPKSEKRFIERNINADDNVSGDDDQNEVSDNYLYSTSTSSTDSSSSNN